MSSIKVKVSSIEIFRDKNNDEYKIILNKAQEILPHVEKMAIWIEGELEKISRQVMRVKMYCEELERKVQTYISKVEDYAQEVDRCNDRIDYIQSHPITVTDTDSEGNTYSYEVVDYVALRSAERDKEEAYSSCVAYKDRCLDAKSVLNYAENLLNKFQSTKAGITSILQVVNSDVYEIKKYINGISYEASFNASSLQRVIESLQNYLASKAIFMPEGSYYEEFASANVAKNTDSVSEDKQAGFSLFGKNKSKNPTSDSASNNKVKDVYGIKATEFRQDRIETMSVAFDNAPSWIVKQIQSVGSKTKIKEKKKTGSYYSPSHKEIVMTKEYNNDVYQEVFKHEFGHYVDHSNGWLSEQAEFKKAFDETCQRLDLSEFNGAKNSMKLFTAVRKSDIAKFDHHLQDIFSSIYMNDYLAENTFMSEGCEFYHHDNDYWALDHNRENEIFADLFAIYSSGDNETISFVEDNFSELSTSFKKLLGA